MVVKAIINALGKGVPKPKKFPQGSEFKKTESETLLQDAQKKVEKIEAGELKPVDTAKILKILMLTYLYQVLLLHQL